ncbi:mechanosensitive ion channel family protein [Kibdelosporangium philippinense]|uniref:Mechanosensitive ion channel family protein n=1 Tax=Kibdelosporangium philippinense TaxID=211113 RepID=A0ABS8ZCM9_9PSEU|nr:mechanosensitive ion channel family protein [Kibdelosporangium philippinense]MCE7005618.1 mechanosensitive ion channel family protein [Kibdelosporangium philippinense]
MAALLAGWLTGAVVRFVARRRYRRTLTKLHENCHKPFVAVLVVAANYIVLFEYQNRVIDGIRHALLLVLIVVAAWLVIRFMFVIEDFVLQRLNVDVPDNRRVRRLRTQVALIRRLTGATITIIAIASMFMTFTELRTLGASLLASAGILGVIAGLAAQTTLTNVFAGMQLALTDSLRYDDVVVVEGEWGRIEEMTLTYVVVHLWDERRLVLPTTYFTKTPFQNWTRHETRVIGAVLLHLDYRAPIDALRVEAQRVVEASDLWDRREWVLQVVDSTQLTMVVRVLASAADAPSAWDLRCEIREKLIVYMRDNYPEFLPGGGQRVTPLDS